MPGEVARAAAVPRSGAPVWVPAILLVAELALLKLRFKTDVLGESTLAWAPVVRALRFNTPWGLCALAGVLLIGRARIVEAYRAESVRLGQARSLLGPGAVHGVSLAFLYLFTAQMLDADVLQRPYAWILPYPWLASGACTVLGAVGLSIPIGVLARIARKVAGYVLGGVALGSAAFLIGSVLSEAWLLAEPLARGTLWLSDRFLGLVLDSRIYEPDEMVLGTEAFPVHVTKYCSGYEGLSIFLLFFCVFLALWREHLRFPRVLLLLPLGMGAAWVLNAARIAVLVLIGTYVSPELAMDGFHVNAGWPLLCGVALGCVALGTRLRAFSNRPAVQAKGVNPTFVFLAPLILWTASGLVIAAVAPRPEELYPARVLLVLLLLVSQRREYRELRPVWGWRPAAFGAGAFVIWTILVYALGSDAGAPRVGDTIPRGEGGQLASWSLLWWTLRALGSCTITPVIEELAFRGYLARRLVAADFEKVSPATIGWIPYLVSSLAFGCLHHNWVAGAAAGLIYGLAYRWRGRLFDAVVAHGATNVLVVIAAFATGDTRIWG